jgi:hypothetical protein
LPNWHSHDAGQLVSLKLNLDLELYRRGTPE